LLTPKLVKALGETVAACRVPQRTSITQHRWGLLAREASRRDTFGLLTVESGGLPAMHERFFDCTDWSASTFKQNIAAWKDAGLVQERKKSQGKRPAVVALWIPSLTETMIWAASHRAEGLAAEEWAHEPLSLSQIWRLAVDACSHLAYPPAHIVVPSEWRYGDTPRREASRLIGQIKAYESGFGNHPCKPYWPGSVTGEDGLPEYMRQRDEALAFVRAADEGLHPSVDAIKKTLKRHPFWVPELTERQIAKVLRIKAEQGDEKRGHPNGSPRNSP
jgi:hypothetical protein